VRIEAAPDVPGVRQVNAALPEGDLSGLSPEAMQQLIFGKPGEDAFLLKGYHIERELGRGGCGAVYLAKPQQNGAEKVAVKIMLSRAQADTRAIAQFKREMDVIAKLRHPNIVRFLDSGSDEGTFFFVLVNQGNKFPADEDFERIICFACAQSDVLICKFVLHVVLKFIDFLLCKRHIRSVVLIVKIKSPSF
jgi:serine/threonine protein kinase